MDEGSNVSSHEGSHGGSDAGSNAGLPAPPTSKARMIAVAVTAVALLAIAIPFVWEPHLDAEPTATAGADATPADAQESPATAACMANAKPANFDFTLKDVDGNQVSLASYKGKVVLLNFWGTWCPPCRMEIPGFIELQDTYRDKGLVIVGVAVEDTPEAVRAYAGEVKINYPLAMVQDDIDAAYGPMYGLPVSFIIARDGSICRKHLGELSKERAEQEIKALL